MNAHLEPTNTQSTGDEMLRELYDDLAWYANECKKALAPGRKFEKFNENSCFEDIEETMSKIRTRRAELGLGGQ